MGKPAAECPLIRVRWHAPITLPAAAPGRLMGHPTGAWHGPHIRLQDLWYKAPDWYYCGTSPTRRYREDINGLGGRVVALRVG